MMALKTAIGYKYEIIWDDNSCERPEWFLHAGGLHWNFWAAGPATRATWRCMEIFILGICVSMAWRDGGSSMWRLSLQSRCYSSRLLTEQSAQDINHNFVTHTHSSFTHNFTSHNFHTTLSCTALENNRFSTISFAFPGFSTAVTAIGKLVRLVDDDLVAKFQRFRLGFYGHFQVRKSC